MTVSGAAGPELAPGGKPARPGTGLLGPAPAQCGGLRASRRSEPDGGQVRDSRKNADTKHMGATR